MSPGNLLLVSSQHDSYGPLMADLAAGGLSVTLRSELPSIGWTQSNRFDCTILDRSALPHEDYRAIAFCIKAFPVVLVADTPLPWLDQWVSRTISPPSTSAALMEAVEAAQADRPHTATGGFRMATTAEPIPPKQEP